MGRIGPNRHIEVSMSRFVSTSIALAFLSATFALSAAATDGLDARTHAKVMRAKRAQAMEQNAHPALMQGLPPVGSQQGQVVDPCKAGVNIGNVYADKNNRAAPRENTVVVTGDVIFAPSRNCR
jgi:hypothetical protein